jgi:drug/metabolite transporter (DMT)-like permease
MNMIFYSRRLKIAGILCIVWGAVSFFLKFANHGIWDINLLSGLLCWGLCFIFFSKEKTDDERVHHLKFQALALGIPIGLFTTHLINYFWLSEPEPDSGKYVRSISAYSSLAMAMVITLALFYYLKLKDERH